MTPKGFASMRRLKIRHRAVALGVAAVLGTAGLLAPATAHANPPVGSGPGGLTLTPDHGLNSAKPIASFATATACPVANRFGGRVELLGDTGTRLQSLSPTFTPGAAPPSGSLSAQSFDTALGASRPSGDYELDLECADDSLGFVVADNVWVHVDRTAGTWQVLAGSTSPVATATALTAAPSSAEQGTDVVLTATVAAQDTAGNDAVGSVEFLNGATSLGTAAVSGGTASKTVTDLPLGTNSITAKFTPTDATAFAASTSTPVSVTISAAGGLNETITVNIPPTGGDGTFTFTVSSNSVTMSDATSNGTNLISAGSLSSVTIDDQRTTSKPGWSVSAQIGDFTGGGHTIDGNDLGWTPSSGSGSTGVTLGDPITAGANPGLKQGARLASAAAGQGTGTTQLGAGLNLQAPPDTPAGSYRATLTITAVEAAG